MSCTSSCTGDTRRALSVEFRRLTAFARVTVPERTVPPLSALGNAPQAPLAPQQQVRVAATVIVAIAFVDILRRAQDDRNPLVHVCWWHVHDTAVASDGLATGLLHQKGHGRGLIEKAKLAVWMLLGCRVGEEAAVEECAVHVTHHGPQVPLRITPRSRTSALLDVCNVLLHGLVPVHAVGLVERVDAATRGDPHVWSCEPEIQTLGVQGEASNALAEGQHHLCGR
mmetsp:Transcript_41543/g.132157  ORF Transcript_41543/g.132157 Transcript_41543/m.132157 type:complete len:226 (-) Transcript_41543:909-1586(-)